MSCVEFSEEQLLRENVKSSGLITQHENNALMTQYEMRTDDLERRVRRTVVFNTASNTAKKIKEMKENKESSERNSYRRRQRTTNAAPELFICKSWINVVSIVFIASVLNYYISVE